MQSQRRSRADILPANTSTHQPACSRDSAANTGNGPTLRRAIVGTFLALTVLSGLAAGQSPTVQITNTTRGGHLVFYSGDGWRIDITGGGSSAVVIGCIPGSCTQFGYTDGGGSFVLTGYMSDAEIGQWDQTWVVGGVTAVPDPLTFYVYPGSAATCSMWATGAFSIFSLDFIDMYYGYPYYQARGSTTVAALLDPSGYCVMYGDTWNIGSSMSAGRIQVTPWFNQWLVVDNGYRPGYFPPPELYYPFYDATALGFLAINLTNGDLVFLPTVVGLIVHFTY